MAMKSKKWKKYLLAACGVSMAAMLSLGVLAGCKSNTSTEEEEEETEEVSKTDTDTLKNSGFEFYAENNKKENDELRAILNTPTTGWSPVKSGPSSETASGIIDLSKWDYIAKPGYKAEGASEYGFSSIAEAYAHWKDESVTVYDRLKFMNECTDKEGKFYNDYEALSSSSKEKKLFGDEYKYGVKFDDVKYLNDELGEVKLHDDGETGEDTLRAKDETSVLMIHNRVTQYNIYGTAQSYKSSTTISLPAGTMAEFSVWVKTAKLVHYAVTGENETPEAATTYAGAYISVSETVGSEQSEMQIKNINTEVTNPSRENNGWEKYTVAIRANAYASTSFTLTLGLGQGSSDDRYEFVNGYAFFDDIQLKLLSASEFTAESADYSCSLSSPSKDKLFDATFLSGRKFTCDLNDADALTPFSLSGTDIALSEEISGSKVLTSASVDPSLGAHADDIASVMSLAEIQGTSNGYLKDIYTKDFENKYPASFSNTGIVVLLSAKGAAYTAKLPDITLQPDERKLVSFWVKTSEVLSGCTGASARVVDGENKSEISAFDSTTLDKVNIDEEEDIYSGWTQCFFFLSNDTDAAKTCHIELSLGPTVLKGASKASFGQGYAAFANFEVMENMKKTQYSYASTGTRAVKVSLTGSVADSTVFDAVSGASDIEHGLARPANFTGLWSDSKFLGGQAENVAPETKGVYAGLLNEEYADNYFGGTSAFSTALNAVGSDWVSVFGDSKGNVARQPLVILNGSGEEQTAYGYFAANATLSADSYQKITMRVMLAEGATASIYLIDTSDIATGYKNTLEPNAPLITYWYDDDGNICASDPTAKDYDAKKGVLFELQKNGLYTSVDKDDTNVYANLWNYEKDSDKNLVTKDGTIAYYALDTGSEVQYYAYYNEDTGERSQKVTCLPKVVGEKTITRYDFSAEATHASLIQVTGTAENKNTWIDVSFYVHTGNAAKKYRVEVWAGARDGSVGIGDGKYVFFDRYSSSSTSNYESILKEAVADLKLDANNLVDGNDPTSNLKAAQYYTFTFYDCLSYLRYDESLDKNNEGNQYSSYEQSAYKEELVFLPYYDEEGKLTGNPQYMHFLNYGATDVTVSKDAVDSNDSHESESSSGNKMSTGNILIAVSSGLLAFVIIFAIGAFIYKRVHKNKPARRAKMPKDKRPKPVESDE